MPISLLFVPGDRPDRFVKAAASGTDLVVLDLEDAVPPARKAQARQAVAEFLAGATRACVRLNGQNTDDYARDRDVLRLPGVAAAMLPKAESAQAIAELRVACAPGTPLIPIIETARGLAAAREIALCPGVHQLAFGSVDFQVDLGIEGDGEELLFARSELVLASRLAGIGAPIDGVTLTVKDTALLRQDALRARRLGFGGKLCIHPDQVGPVREVFLPDAQTIAWARGVLAAAQAAAGGAVLHEGRMVDRPVMERARAILERAGA